LVMAWVPHPGRYAGQRGKRAATSAVARENRTAADVGRLSVFSRTVVSTKRVAEQRARAEADRIVLPHHVGRVSAR
jgi:hypothetical protein